VAGASEPAQYPVADLRIDPDMAADGKEHLTPHSFQIFLSERLGGKVTQQTNFVSELERSVPKFYGTIAPFWARTCVAFQRRVRS